MQNPTDQPETSIPAETVREGPNDMSGTFTVRRKAAKRSEPCYLAPPPQNLAVPLSIPPRKKQRLQEPLPTTTDEAARKTPSPDIPVSLPLPATLPSTDIVDASTLRRSSRPRRSQRQTQLPPIEATRKTASPVLSAGLPPPAADNVDTNSVRDTQPNAGATGRWTLEEDAKLNFAVTNTCKKKRGKEHRKDWAAVAALVPGRTENQCSNRWKDVLVSNIAPTAGRTGTWTEDEDSKLKAAVQTHGGKNWREIAALVPGRAENQCWHRWKHVLDPNIGTVSGRKGSWTSDEDSKLKAAVQAHGDKDWGAIAALVPGRTKVQCCKRWHDVLVSNIDPTTARAGTWASDEDSKLKAAVQTHGGKDWFAIAALVPGRTKKQCADRWHDVLNPSIGTVSGRKGTWTADEDKMLKAAVQTHSGKNWGKIAALVPGRAGNQCWHRWNHVLDPNIRAVSGRKGGWTAEEDKKLKAAVQTHGGKNWVAVAMLVPNRTKKQCVDRWRKVLDPGIVSGHKGTWTADEDKMLKAAVQTHGGKNWGKIAALVPGRAGKQCWSRWKYVLDPNIGTVSERKGSLTAEEDSKLKAAVQVHGGKDWAASTALVPGRAGKQCRDRWIVLCPNIGTLSGRKGSWTADEDSKLKAAVGRLGDRDWGAIAALVPGRVGKQCSDRWRKGVDHNRCRKGSWTADEDSKLKAAVQKHGGKDWGAIAALVPGRMEQQCLDRWRKRVDPNRSRKGNWTADEDKKLKAAVQTHGGKGWSEITALFPGRAEKECWHRWLNVLGPNIDPRAARLGKWTAEEDRKLKAAVQTHSDKDWGAIAALVPGRIRKQCLDRWRRKGVDPNRSTVQAPDLG
jgi:hypothetical protein